MIQLVFQIGSALRRVIINNRNISLVTQETGWVPITFDLNKLKDDPRFTKLSENEKKLWLEIRDLDTEEEIAEDIITDFNKTGWRLFKRIDGTS